MIEPVHCGSNSILKVRFFGTPCISIWSGSEVSEENLQKCKRATVCIPTWPRLKKQLAVFVFVFVLVFAWGLIFVSVFDFYQKHKRETVRLTPWPMLTMSCLCLSFSSSEALSLSLWLTKSAKEQLCALHLGLDKTSSCLGSTNWQIGQQYFHRKDLLLIGLSLGLWIWNVHLTLTQTSNCLDVNTKSWTCKACVRMKIIDMSGKGYCWWFTSKVSWATKKTITMLLGIKL